MTDTAETGFAPVKDTPARLAARQMVVNRGVQLETYEQLVDFAKNMANSGWAVRKELRGNLGSCMMIIELADQWGFNRWQLGRACYVVNDVLCFESQVIHALVEKFAPIKERLRVRYDGEGEKRKAIITGHIIGEVDPLEYISPEIGKITPKNSPLWKTDPDQQLFYFSSNRWARRYCPDVLLGIHDVDQMESPSLVPDDKPARPHIGFVNAKDITPVVQRLQAEPQTKEGFATAVETIDSELNAARAAGQAETE